MNGIYPNQGYTNSVGTGLFELDARKNGSEWGDVTISILCGNILPTDVCCVKTDDTTVTLYYNCKFAYYSCKLTVLSDEAVLEEDPTEMFQFATEYYGTTTPANAVYGVVRNQASSLGGKEADEFVDTTSNQTITGTKIFKQTTATNPLRFLSAWERTGNSSTKYNFIEFLDSNSARTGVIGQKTAGTDRYGVYLQCGDTASLQVLTDGTKNYFLLSESPPATDNTTSIATTKWVNDKEYLTAIPVASQTVLGGVKVYKDSEGYFCIDTQ